MEKFNRYYVLYNELFKVNRKVNDQEEKKEMFASSVEKQQLHRSTSINSIDFIIMEIITSGENLEGFVKEDNPQVVIIIDKGSLKTITYEFPDDKSALLWAKLEYGI